MAHRWSIGFTAVAINLTLWHVGIIFNEFSGVIDAIGARLCLSTPAIALALVPLTVVYSTIRRFATNSRAGKALRSGWNSITIGTLLTW
jgi:hypothetical protein